MSMGLFSQITSGKCFLEESYKIDPPTDVQLPKVIVKKAGVVLDMGSGGSRISLFGWDEEHTVQPIPYLGPDFFYHTSSHGIAGSSFKSPEQAAASLRVLFDKATKDLIQWGVEVEETVLFVYGTGGIRALSRYEQEIYLDAIYEFITSNYSFKLVDGWLGVLTGQEEGTLDWLSVQQYRYISEQYNDNFLEGEFSEYNGMLGMLDMGGATTEISFLPKSLQNPFDPFSFQEADFLGRTLFPYSECLIGLGKNDAYKAQQQFLIDYNYRNGDSSDRYPDPCMPPGAYIRSSTKSPLGNKVHFDGTGSVINCNIIIDQLLNSSSRCTYRNCGVGGSYQPLVEDIEFIAFSQFYAIAKYFGETGRAPLANIKEKAEAYCNTPIDELKELYPDESTSSISKYCFKGLYMYRLLTKGFGFPDNSTQIVFEKHLFKSASASWALGMMVRYVGGIK